MKRQDYIKATQAAIVNQPKYFAKHHNDRVTGDSGTVTDETPIGGRSYLTDHYKFLRENRLLENTVFLWDGSAGMKTRTVGVNQYAAKLYSMSASNNDAVQATEANQPFMGGGIAPNEKRRLKNLIDNKLLIHPNITVDCTGINGFSITTVLKPLLQNIGTAANKGTFTSGEPELIFNNAGEYRLFTPESNLMTWRLPSPYDCKSKIITIVANSAGITLYLNGNLIPIHSGTFSTFVRTLTGLLSSSTGNDTFAGEIYHHQIFNKALSASEIQAQHAYLRLQHPEIEGINIGNQHWATSNYEGVVTGNGTVIPEVQAAANVEKVVNGGFDADTNWNKGIGWTISGGTANCDGSTLVIQSGLLQPSIISQNKWYKTTFTITSVTAGFIRVVFGANSGSYSPGYSTVGTYQRYVNSGSNNSSFEFYASIGFIGSIDNVSVEEVGWSGLQAMYDGLIAQGRTVAQATEACQAWCYYNNDPLLGAVYGKLYNWYAVDAIRQNPPSGWSVPTAADFTQLAAFLGGASVAGGKMKKDGLTYWITPNTGATNESGFTALGSGRRNASGVFERVLNFSYFWLQNTFMIYAKSDDVASITLDASTIAGAGLSLRLIRNEPVGATERTIETGYITNALGATNLDIIIPFGYRVDSIKFESATDISGLSAKLRTVAGVDLETLFTAQTVSAGVAKTITAATPQTIQQQDPTVRINGTKVDVDAVFTVTINLTKVVFS